MQIFASLNKFMQNRAKNLQKSIDKSMEIYYYKPCCQETKTQTAP